VKAGVIAGESVGGAFVFLQKARVRVGSVSRTVALLDEIFAGEIVQVEARGPRETSVWLGRADSPAAPIVAFDRSRHHADVPVFTEMTFVSWPGI